MLVWPAVPCPSSRRRHGWNVDPSMRSSATDKLKSGRGMPFRRGALARCGQSMTMARAVKEPWSLRESGTARTRRRGCGECVTLAGVQEASARARSRPWALAGGGAFIPAPRGRAGRLRPGAVAGGCISPSAGMREKTGRIGERSALLGEGGSRGRREGASWVPTSREPDSNACLLAFAASRSPTVLAQPPPRPPDRASLVAQELISSGRAVASWEALSARLGRTELQSSTAA